MDGLMMDYPLTVPYLLDRAARYFPRVEVVSRRPDRSVARSSYAEVCRRARQLAGGLVRLGVGRGDREGATATAEELRAFLEHRFEKFWLPDEFVFTTQIPRTAAGKFRKTTLRDEYGGILTEQPRPGGP